MPGEKRIDQGPKERSHRKQQPDELHLLIGEGRCFENGSANRMPNGKAHNAQRNPEWLYQFQVVENRDVKQGACF